MRSNRYHVNYSEPPNTLGAIFYIVFIHPNRAFRSPNADRLPSAHSLESHQ